MDPATVRWSMIYRDEGKLFQPRLQQYLSTNHKNKLVHKPFQKMFAQALRYSQKNPLCWAFVITEKWQFPVKPHPAEMWPSRTGRRVGLGRRMAGWHLVTACWLLSRRQCVMLMLCGFLSPSRFARHKLHCSHLSCVAVWESCFVLRQRSISHCTLYRASHCNNVSHLCVAGRKVYVFSICCNRRVCMLLISCLSQEVLLKTYQIEYCVWLWIAIYCRETLTCCKQDLVTQIVSRASIH